MSDMAVFKSVKDVAQEHSMEIGAAAAGIVPSIPAFCGKTNLGVIDKLCDAGAQLASCNMEFKDLVSRDADGIEGLADVFDLFDASLASNMEV